MSLPISCVPFRFSSYQPSLFPIHRLVFQLFPSSFFPYFFYSPPSSHSFIPVSYFLKLARAHVCNSCVLFYFLAVPLSYPQFQKITMILNFCHLIGKRCWCIRMSAFFLGENLLELTARYEQSLSIQPIQFLAVLVSHVKPELRQRAYFRNANYILK